MKIEKLEKQAKKYVEQNYKINADGVVCKVKEGQKNPTLEAVSMRHLMDIFIDGHKARKEGKT